MADTIKIQKIKVAGLVVYPATILDAVKDAKSVKVEGVETNEDYGKTLRQILEAIKTDVKALSDLGLTSEDIALITTNKELLEKLDNTEATEGSIKYQLAALKKEIMTGDATGTVAEAYDTLKEIADWIGTNSDAEAAAGLATSIAANAAAIGVAPKEAVGTEGEEGYEAAVEGSGILKEIADIKSDMATDAVTVSATDGVTKGGVTYKYVHDASKTAADAAFVKVGGDAEGHVVIGDAVATADVTALLVDGEGKDLYDANGAAAAVQGETTSTVKDLVDAIGVEAVAESAEGAGDGKEATGLYKKIEEAKEAAIAAQHDKTTVTAGTANGTISVDGGEDITIFTPEAETQLSVKEGSANYVGVDDHEVEIKTSDVATDATGLVTAKAVYDYALTAEATSDTTEYDDVF